MTYRPQAPIGSNPQKKQDQDKLQPKEYSDIFHFQFKKKFKSKKESSNFIKRIAKNFTYEASIELKEKQQIKIDFSFAKFGQCHISNLTLPEHKLTRSLNDIRKDGNNNFSLYLVESGHASITHLSREENVGPGHCILLDHGKAHERRCHEASTVIGLHIPKSLAASAIPHPEEQIFTVIPPIGWGAVLSAAMALLRPKSLNGASPPPDAVVTQILSLLALALPPRPTKGGRLCQYERVRMMMSERSNEPTLGPADIAAAEGISKRTLHSLFAAQETTFRAELIGLRLNKAKTLLDDPRFDRHTIAEIALLNGFPNTSHFVRRFREAYGLPPALYRAFVKTQEDRAVKPRDDAR